MADVAIYHSPANGSGSASNTRNSASVVQDGQNQNGIFGALFQSLTQASNAQTSDFGLAQTASGEAQANNSLEALLGGDQAMIDALIQRNGDDLVNLQSILANISGDSEFSAHKTGDADTDKTLSILANLLKAQKDNDGLQVGNLLLLDGEDLGTEEGLLARLTQQINDLKKTNEATGILFNLTPEQVTQIQGEIQNAQQSGKNPELPEGFNFIMVSLTKPDTTDIDGGELAVIQTLPFSQAPAAAGRKAAENPLTGSDTDETSQPIQGSLGSLLQNGGEDFDSLLDIQSSSDKFSALLKNAAKIKALAQNNVAPNTATATPQTAAATANTTETLPSLPFSSLIDGSGLDDGTLFSQTSWNNASLQAMGLPNNGGTHAGNATSLTNLTTQSSHATQAHPGTSLVAATLNRGAAATGNKTITLQLDPPELGRIEVRMEFGKDRSLKATVISEKPEAHLMLQRDSHALERALQDSGLDADGSSLEFSLADDGHFNQDGSHDGSRNQSSHGGNGSEEDIDLIETTMNWRVDEQSGHIRYDIWA